MFMLQAADRNQTKPSQNNTSEVMLILHDWFDELAMEDYIKHIL